MVGVKLEQDTVGGEWGGGGDGPVEVAEGAVDGAGDGLFGDVETLSVLALHQEEGDRRGRAAGSPSDGECRAGRDDLVAGWCGQDIEAGDLSEDAGGGGECQKASLCE